MSFQYGPDWEVKNPGDPNCKHRQFQESTLTSNPPIRQVVCEKCGRRIWQRSVRLVERKWPE